MHSNKYLLSLIQTWKRCWHSVIMCARPCVAARFSLRSFWSGRPVAYFFWIDLKKARVRKNAGSPPGFVFSICTHGSLRIPWWQRLVLQDTEVEQRWAQTNSEVHWRHLVLLHQGGDVPQEVEQSLQNLPVLIRHQQYGCPDSLQPLFFRNI